eukprot:g10468.t1
MLKPLGYATAQIGKNHLGDRNDFLPTVHGFDEFYGNLYHLNAEEEPELPDYPKDPAFRAKYGPRGVMDCKASDRDDPTVDPRFGRIGKQVVKDTGPLTKKRMVTIDDDIANRASDFIKRQSKAGKPFFIWVNFTHMHLRTHPKPGSVGQSGRWQSIYHDTVIDHDKNVGTVLKALDDAGVADNTFVMYSTDNGPHMNSWPDAGMTPFRNEKNSNWEGAYRVPCMVRWPGMIKPGSVSNEIVGHHDWFPTLLAMAGDPNVKQKLLKGYKVGDMTYKVHLDGYNLAKQSIISFVEAVTTDSSKDYVPPADRIAVFDNDGTLWSERPVYFQLLFAIDRIKQLAPKHPEWKDKQPFKAVLENDQKALAASGEKGLIQLVMASHAGNTTAEFDEIVRKWIATARHPRFKRHYTDLVYQPMLELLAYLRANGFKTFIVSGGGIEFMRPWVHEVYGIHPEQVIGSSIKVKYELRDGKPVLVRLPEIDFIDDKAEKPIGIHKFIGRRPIAAFGNSDGDLQMLQWATIGTGRRFGMIVHHTDGEREWAYDRKSHVGRLDKGLEEAKKRGWTVLNMKRDWKVIYPFEIKK